LNVNKLGKDFSKARIEDHAAMSLDFKGEAFTFKATAAGILHNLAHCIELMQQREDFLKKKLNKEIEKRKKLEEHVKEMSKDKKKSYIIAGPDFEEGPHSNIKEEQFFDAIDSTLDTLEQEEERVSSNIILTFILALVITLKLTKSECKRLRA
jgi:collagen type IV alpha-3-binding protein